MNQNFPAKLQQFLPIYQNSMQSCIILMTAAAAVAKSLQSWPTLYDPIDGSPPGSLVLGILQARTLEWVAISFSNARKWSCSVVSNSSRPHGLQPTRLLRPWDFPGRSTGVGCHRLFWYWWKIMHFLSTNFGSFSLSADFS